METPSWTTDSMQRKFLILAFGLALVLNVSTAGCRSQGKTKLSVFIAGSLVIPADDLEQAYEELNPDIDVEMEAHGSIQVIRHVTEIHDLIDVVIPADYSLIPMLMYPTSIPDTETPYADWYVKFATNDLTLAYTPDSLYADEINSENWYEILARDEVKFGLSDPRFDASGYRTLMIIQLAEGHYQDPTIFEQVFLGQFKQPIRVKKQNGRFSIHVPEVLEPSENAHILLRGSSVALISLLESGDIDYAFQYKSVSKQHDFEYVDLPEELNLGSEEHTETYETVEVQLDFQRFSTVPPLFTGEVIGYGVTIPNNAPHPQEAEDFVAFLLGPEGQEILRQNDHPPLNVPVTDAYQALNPQIQTLCEPEP
jgi:molybdate/tungstate transport system substrate-binding protein